MSSDEAFGSGRGEQRRHSVVLNEIFMEAMMLDVRLLFYTEMKPPEGSWRRMQDTACAKSGIVQN